MHKNMCEQCRAVKFSHKISAKHKSEKTAENYEPITKLHISKHENIII